MPNQDTQTIPFLGLHHFPLYPFSGNQPFIDRHLICFHSFSLAELNIEMICVSTAMNSKVWPYEWIDDNDCSLSFVLIGVFVLVCNLATFKNKQKATINITVNSKRQDKKVKVVTSSVVQGPRLHSQCRGLGLIPGQVTSSPIMQASPGCFC